MEKVCPDALFINYTNPMSMLTLAWNRYTDIKTVGLCHSHQSCVPMLLGRLDLPKDGVNYKIAGINHMAWLLEITRNGEDYYPEIKAPRSSLVRLKIRLQSLLCFIRSMLRS